MDKLEQDKRKQILKELREKEKMNFDESLPMSRQLFEQLFDLLDNELKEKICDHTNKITSKFLIDNSLDREIIINWLKDKGGYCDCEVLANVEGLFE